MNFNFLALVLAALSTLVVGFIWYNPKVFGNAWMKEVGMTEADAKGANMAKIFGLAVVYAFFIAFILQFLVIHQFGVFGTVEGNVNDPQYKAFMEAHGDAFRTFKHGALHGFMTGLFLILPVVGTNSLFERRSFKYVFIVGGYWAVCSAIMGGIICMMK